jgi:Xaa-Pro aminopeptidase
VNGAERIATRVSDDELQRRWRLVRAAMAAKDIDVVVMQSTNDWLGGYVKWITDIPANNGYPRTVLFSAAQPMSVIEMGGFGGRTDLDGADAIHRGVGTVLTTPSFSSIDYTHPYDAELAIDALAGAKKVGWIGKGGLPFTLVNTIEARLGNSVQFTDFTEDIDRIKAVKSAEEIALIRRTAELQDEVFRRVLDFIKPGLRDVEVTAYAQEQGQILGSEQGIFLGASAPLGIRSPFRGRHFQNRTLESGDHLSLLVEINGPGGFYTEIARTVVLGKASPELKAAFAAVKDAQDFTLSLIKPGASCAAIHAAHNAYMQERGLPPETRLYAHGQGYDMVERPLIRSDEPMTLEQDMCLAIHPGYETDRVFAVICDNYLVEKDGPGACLHRTEKKIFEVD